jgi:hypothetical protein
MVRRETAWARMAAFVGTAAAAAALAGCSGIDHADIDGQTPAPDGSSLETTGGTMAPGIAIAFTPHVWTRSTFGGSSERPGLGVTVSSSDPSVLMVAEVTGGGKAVAWAVAPGSARVILTYEGQTALEIPVVVGAVP